MTEPTMPADSGTVRPYEMAEQYARLGCSVIPIVLGTKKPALDTWKRYQQESPDTSERFEMFSDNGVGVAVVCGAVSGNLAVIDFDAETAYRAWAADHVEIIRNTIVVKTSKGAHVWVRTTTPTSTTRFRDGDIKGEGGYVLAPGSVHPSGVPYIFLSNPDRIVQVEHLSDLGLEPAPASLGTFIAERIPVGKAALEFIAFGAPIGQQRDCAVAAARNLLSCGKNVKEVADLLWKGLQASPADSERDPWRYEHAVAIAADLASKPAPPMREKLSVALTTVVPTERIPVDRIRIWTAREIGESTPAEIAWLIKPWCAHGIITELDAKIKSGKTTLLGYFCSCLLDGKDCLGHPTTRTKVLYLTEQGAVSYREMLKRAGLLDRDDLFVMYYHDTVGIEWQDIVAEAIQVAKDRGCELLIIDTLPQFARLKGDDENSAGAALEAIRPLQEAASIHGLGVILVRHERKGIGEVGEAARGSSAFGGSVDIILSLRRAEGNSRATIRVLHSLSRFDDTPPELVIERTEDGYLVIGDEARYAVTEAKRGLVESLPHQADEALTTDELCSATGAKRTIMRDALIEAMTAGSVIRLGSGKRKDPYRFYLSVATTGGSDRKTAVPAESAEIVSVGTTVLSATERNVPQKHLFAPAANEPF